MKDCLYTFTHHITNKNAHFLPATSIRYISSDMFSIIRDTTVLCTEAIACSKDLRMRSSDILRAYLQGVQGPSEQMILRQPEG